MQLKSFRVRNFRSINDSGPIEVSRITSVLGRNESGKSNLLRALYSLNPAEGFKALNPVKDFPRGRRLEDCKDNTPVVDSTWLLDQNEHAELTEIFPRAGTVSSVTISRRYDKTRLIVFQGLSEEAFDESDVKAKIRRIVPAVKAAADKLSGPAKTTLENAADTFENAVALSPDALQWAQKAVPALATLRKALAAADSELSDRQEQILVELEETASSIAGDDAASAKARTWVVGNMPEFIYVDEYPELRGHQNIAEYQQRKNQNQLNPSDVNFEKLCKVAGLDPVKLQELLSQDQQETRNQLANRAGSVVTSEVRRLWKDRALKIRFNLDANHLDTLISDPNATYDIEVNLDERSRGFQWFFSFYVTFSADTKGGNAEDAILLLDEPGLYLHAKSQSDLLGHFEKDFKNQIIYTTHSPFMVPTHNLDSIRTVSINENSGTTVTNSPSGDSRTLFPLQAALGYSLAQSLFVGPNNLVVEGVTDYWILSAVSTHFSDLKLTALHPDLTITPAGGAQKVSYMVALLSSEELNVIVLLDQESESQKTKSELVKAKLISENNVVFISEAFGSDKPAEADVEDLLDSDVYEKLVRESYASELATKTLTLNPRIPRIAKRIEQGLLDLGITFHKTRPARLFLKKMANSPDEVLPEVSAKQFETIFQVINDRFKKAAR
jgi:predicted ATP-dependent endonuclease of OLD family